MALSHPLITPNPNIPAAPQTHPIIPPNPTLQFVTAEDRLTPNSLQFLQQLYAAVRGINSGESFSLLFDRAFGGDEGIIIYRGEDFWAGLPPGPETYVLTTHGPDTSPTWEPTITSIIAGTGLEGGGTEGDITISLIVPVAIIHGGTGATTAPQALINLGAAPLDSPFFTGDPRAPTPAPGDNDNSIATTAFVAQSYAPLDSPVFIGDPQAPTPAPGDNDTSIATTAFVMAAVTAGTGGGLTGLTGDVTAIGPGTVPATLATVNPDVGTFQGITVNAKGLVTAAVNQNYAPLDSPAFTGIPTAPTAAFGTNTTQLATTAFVAAGDLFLQDQIDSIAGGGGIGTITGVAAGTGLTGGGTSGGVTLSLIVPVAIVHGGTGATDAATARTNLGAEPVIAAGTTAQYWRGDKSWQLLDKAAVGLANVDNTSDLNKPISTATQTALNLKAPLASPIFTGNPTAPTATAGDNDTTIATTAFVTTAVTAATVGGLTGLTGDVTATGPGTVAGTLATVNINVGTFQGLTVNAKGLVTAAANQGYLTSTTGLTNLAIRDTSAAFDVTLAATSVPALTAGRSLTFDMSNVAHTLDFGPTANTISFPTAAAPSLAALNVAGTWSATQTSMTLATTTLTGVTTLPVNGAITAAGELSVGSGTAPLALLSVGGYTSANASMVTVGGTFTSPVTLIQRVLVVNPTFAPSGASLSSIAAFTVGPTLNSTSFTLTYTGLNSTLVLGASFTGIISTANLYQVSDPQISGGSVTSLNAYSVTDLTNGNGITSGTVSNRGLRVAAFTAAAGVGGTIVNESVSIVMPSGSSVGTTNYGIRITGAGGALSTNFALYSDSTAPMQIGGMFQFLGSTSAFPALKRSTTTIQVRQADDSAYATLDALSMLDSGVAPTGTAGTGYARRTSPDFLGTPTAPTAAAATNTTQIATTAYVKAQGYITGNQTITITGDADGSGTTAITLTFDAVNLNVGTFQGITVNAKGLVTAAVNQSYLTANQTITLSGDVTGSGTTAITTSIAANAVGTAEIANSNVTYAKIQNVVAARLLGNPTGLAAAPSEISLGTGLSFAGTVLNATGVSGLSGMTAGQIPIAASATTITSSANLSGDVTSNATLVTTLATVNINVGTFQGLTVNAKGLVTAAANQNYAPLASPTFTGIPAAPTASAGTNTTQLATTAFVTSAVSTGVGAYLPLAGGTLTGNLTISPATGASSISLSAVAANLALLNYNTAGVLRWRIGKNAVAEAAGAGSDFMIQRFDDAGVFASTPVWIERLTGNVGIGGGDLPQSKLMINAPTATARSYQTFVSASDGNWAYMGDWGKTVNIASYGTDNNNGLARGVDILVNGALGMRINSVGSFGFGGAPSQYFHITGAATSTTMMYISCTQTNAAVADQYGLYFFGDATPTGATLNNYYGIFYQGSLTGGGAVPTVVGGYHGITSRLTLQAEFTGSITAGYAFDALNPVLSGKTIGLYVHYYGAVITNGNLLASGTVSNRGLWLNGINAESATGGTVDNQTMRVVVPSGGPAGGTTLNYGIYLTGNGGTATLTGVVTNYALYSDSTLPFRIAGLLQFGGSTESFPALKGEGGVLKVRAADDSDYSDIDVGTLLDFGTSPTGTAGSGYVRASGPTFVGVPTAPTAVAATDTTQIATTAYVKSQLYLTANQSISLTGAVTGSGTTSIATTLAASLAITTPAISGGTITGLTGLGIRDTSAAFDVTIAMVSSPILSAGRLLTFNMNNVAHVLNLGATANTINFPNAGAPSLAALNVAGTWTAAQTNLTLITPALGTPSAGILTSCTGLPISTGVAGLAVGIATFLGTPNSANLIAAVTDETGTGALVFATNPILVTPNLGTPSAGVLTNCTGLPVAGIAALGAGVAAWLGAPTSANLAAAVTGETGTGALVFGTGPAISAITLLGIRDTSAAFDVNLIAASTPNALSANRALTFNMNNIGHVLEFGGVGNTITFPVAAAPSLAALNVVGTWSATQTSMSLSAPTLSGNITIPSGMLTSLGNLYLSDPTLVTVGGLGASHLQVVGTGAGYEFSAIQYSVDATGAGIGLAKSRGTVGVAGAVISGDAIVRFRFCGDDGTTLSVGAEHQVFVDGTVSTAIVPMRYSWSTKNAAGSLVERLQLYSSGGFSLGNAGADPGVGNALIQGGKVMLAGASSAFPMISRSTTEMRHRLADDTAYGPMAASVLAQVAGETGNRLEFRSLTELTTIAAAATTNTAILIPANAVVFAVSVRVTTIIPTAANFTVGVTGTPARYGTGILVAAGTTSPGTLAGPLYYAAATAIVITPNLTPATATGVVRVTIHYYLVTPPTS